MNTQSQENEFQINDFYRIGYRRTMKWLVFLSIVCAVLTIILTWMVYDQKQPLYYAAVTTGEVVPMHALSAPILTDDFIMQWSALAARRIYNLSFDTYQQQLNQLKDKFTPTAWNEMTAAMQGIIKQITGNRLVVSAVVSGSPVILAHLVIHGRYTWRVQMKLLVTYISASAQRQRDIVVTMNVQRVPTLDASQGIQIIDFSSGDAVQ